MKQGILFRLTILAHEDQAEFADLLAALIDEHRPAGMTERHLIEELAAIIWRKRRVLLAKGAAINRGWRRVSTTARFRRRHPICFAKQAWSSVREPKSGTADGDQAFLGVGVKVGVIFGFETKMKKA